ncbi:MAG: TM2 domain-containing protein [Slackia sp.]
MAAGLLGIFLGSLGVHKFYLGYNTAGFIMLGVAILGGLLSFGIATSIVWLIGLIEGIIYLVKPSEFELSRPTCSRRGMVLMPSNVANETRPHAHAASFLLRRVSGRGEKPA